MKRFFVFSFALLVLAGSLAAQVQEKLPYIGFHLSNINLFGGEPNESKFWAGGQFGYYFSQKVGFELAGGYGWTRPKESYTSESYLTYFKPITATLKFNLVKDSKFTPYLLIGAGLLYWDRRDITGNTDDFSLSEKLGSTVFGEERTIIAVGGLGANYFLSKVFSLEGGVRFNYLVNQDLDMNGFGGDQYGILEGRLGFNIHFGKSKDSDGDGIRDNIDMAKMDPEDFDGFEDEDGAPDPDNDNDGVLDVDDGEPNIPEDIDGFEDEDGVPDPDNDGDGILDENDKSPNIAEDFDGFEDEDGAPDLDNDGDGILDKYDKCPNQPETKNGYMDSDGCPDTKPVVETFEKPVVFEGVTFRTGSDYLHLDAKAVLDKVVKIMKDNPSMKLVINGYTDNTGPRQVNVDLSRYRAIAVKKYLVSKGVGEFRLTVNGYGPDNPISTNATEVGRAKNRRIEFVKIK